MIWVNCKIYKETFGDGVLRMAKICRKVAKKTGVKIIPVVSPLDLWRVKKEVGGLVWLQHVDIFFEGKKTGWVSPLQAMILGAGGTLINHSEHEISPGKIRQTLAYLRRDKWISHWQKMLRRTDEKWSMKNKTFPIMVCIKTRGQIERWVKRLDPAPDFVAYEPPELISGKISVSQAKPAMIKKVVNLLPGKDIIVGAGIHNKNDIEVALKLGAKGVLVSSAVIKDKNPEKVLLELASGFTKN